MTSAITLEELLLWNDETSKFWKAHLEANPALLELPCGIGGTTNVKEFVTHIWGVELRWGERITGLALTEKKDMPTGPLEAIYELHERAVGIFRGLLDNSSLNWDEMLTFQLPAWKPSTRTLSRRKVVAHAMLHGQRHWAQLATLVRAAGSPSGFMGDILFSSALQ